MSIPRHFGHFAAIYANIKVHTIKNNEKKFKKIQVNLLLFPKSGLLYRRPVVEQNTKYRKCYAEEYVQSQRVVDLTRQHDILQYVIHILILSSYTLTRIVYHIIKYLYNAVGT